MPTPLLMASFRLGTPASPPAMLRKAGEDTGVPGKHRTGRAAASGRTGLTTKATHSARPTTRKAQATIHKPSTTARKTRSAGDSGQVIYLINSFSSRTPSPRTLLMDVSFCIIAISNPAAGPPPVRRTHKAHTTTHKPPRARRAPRAIANPLPLALGDHATRLPLPARWRNTGFQPVCACTHAQQTLRKDSGATAPERLNTDAHGLKTRATPLPTISPKLYPNIRRIQSRKSKPGEERNATPPPRPAERQGREACNASMTGLTVSIGAQPRRTAT
jgi:hypothetical protein